MKRSENTRFAFERAEIVGLKERMQHNVFVWVIYKS